MKMDSAEFDQSVQEEADKLVEADKANLDIRRRKFQEVLEIFGGSRFLKTVGHPKPLTPGYLWFEFGSSNLTVSCRNEIEGVEYHISSFNVDEKVVRPEQVKKIVFDWAAKALAGR